MYGFKIVRRRGEALRARLAAAGGLPDRFFRDWDTGPEMAVIPAGVFWMGSPEGEDGRSCDEGPQRLVAISRPFAVGRLPVTFDDWDSAIEDGWRYGHRPSDQGWGRGRRPVVDVSWRDARAYADWLSERTGHCYRLLTEVEWEYAARAGAMTAYATGAALERGQAHFSEAGWGSAGGTVEAGRFPPNAFGLYDMHGNVWEWVEDRHGGDGQDGGEGRAIRGGSWCVDRSWLRSACRGWQRPELRSDDVGFRVARRV